MRRVLLALMCASSLSLAGVALAQDVGAAREAVCCGAACCLIDGNCRMSGAENPANSCQTCNPALSQSSWSDTAGCTPGADSGAPRTDAGTPPPPPPSGGCSAAGGGSSAPAVLALLAGLALFRRRC